MIYLDSTWLLCHKDNGCRQGGFGVLLLEAAQAHVPLFEEFDQCHGRDALENYYEKVFKDSRNHLEKFN